MIRILPPPPPPARLAILLFLAALAVPAAVTAQMVGSAVCPTNSDGQRNTRFLVLAPGSVGSTRIDIYAREVTLADVNLLFTGAATSAGLRIGLVDGSGNFVHGAYLWLGTVNSGRSVPASTTIFHSLEPNTRYAARIFLDEIKGPVEERECFEMQIQGTVYRTICEKPTLSQICFQMAPAPN